MLLFVIILFRSKTSLVVLSEALKADRELLPTKSTQINVDESDRSNPQSVRVSICRRWGMYA